MITPNDTDTTIVRQIGLSLRQMRLDRNMSQDELARTSGLDRTTISRMEAGRAASLLTLVQVLRAMDKLDTLSAFQTKVEISPLQQLKIMEQKRKKASPKKTEIIKKTKSSW